MKYKSEQHRLWHIKVEGQIKSAINDHPEYFSAMDQVQMRNFQRSLAKRIVGEILAAAYPCGGKGD